MVWGTWEMVLGHLVWRAYVKKRDEK